MNNVTTKTEAGREPGGAGPLARLVRHGVVACMLACTAAGAMANGQDRNGPPMRDRYENRVQDSRFDQRAFEESRRAEQAMREENRARQEQQMRDGGARDDGGRRVRMTPDERLELKRQINEAGRDLYPNARRR